MTQQLEEHVYLRFQKDGADKDYNLHLKQDEHGPQGAYEAEFDQDSDEEALGMAPGC